MAFDRSNVQRRGILIDEPLPEQDYGELGPDDGTISDGGPVQIHEDRGHVGGYNSSGGSGAGILVFLVMLFVFVGVGFWAWNTYAKPLQNGEETVPVQATLTLGKVMAYKDSTEKDELHAPVLIPLEAVIATGDSRKNFLEVFEKASLRADSNTSFKFKKAKVQDKITYVYVALYSGRVFVTDNKDVKIIVDTDLCEVTPLGTKYMVGKGKGNKQGDYVNVTACDGSVRVAHNLNKAASAVLNKSQTLKVNKKSLTYPKGFSGKDGWVAWNMKSNSSKDAEQIKIAEASKPKKTDYYKPSSIKDFVIRNAYGEQGVRREAKVKSETVAQSGYEEKVVEKTVVNYPKSQPRRVRPPRTARKSDAASSTEQKEKRYDTRPRPAINAQADYPRRRENNTAVHVPAPPVPAPPRPGGANRRPSSWEEHNSGKVETDNSIPEGMYLDNEGRMYPRYDYSEAVPINNDKPLDAITDTRSNVLDASKNKQDSSLLDADHYK